VSLTKAQVLEIRRSCDFVELVMRGYVRYMGCIGLEPESEASVSVLTR
jgi:hypothetical protein